MQRSSNLFQSFKFACEGIKTAFAYNRNLRNSFLIAAILVLLSFYLQLSAIEFIIVIVMILLVISCEMINSVIEEMVNLITQEHRKEAKIAKDVSAGMVLLTAIGAGIVGLLIFTPHVLTLLNH